MSKSTHLLWSYSRHKICGVIQNSGSSSPCKSNGMSQVEIQKSTSLISSKLMKLTILFPLDWVSKVKSPWDEHICREFVDITSYQTVFWLQIWKKICKEWTCPLILDQLSFHQIPNDGNSDNRLAKGFCIPVVIVMELAYSPDCFVDRLLHLGLKI